MKEDVDGGTLQGSARPVTINASEDALRASTTIDVGFRAVRKRLVASAAGCANGSRAVFNLSRCRKESNTQSALNIFPRANLPHLDARRLFKLSVALLCLVDQVSKAVRAQAWQGAG